MNYLKSGLIFIGLLLSMGMYGQSPQAFSYQAVATDANGDELTGQDIGIKAVILSGSINGTVEWEELHYITTDVFGLFNILVGYGNPNGGAQDQFSDIDWSQGPYYLRIEMDVTGGSTFVHVGTNQLLSVPFSLYADDAEKANTAIYADTAIISQTALVSLYADSSAISHTAFETLYADSAGVSGLADYALLADSASFAQNSQLAVNALNATNAINAQNANFAQAAYVAITDEDTDSTNEIQNLAIMGDTISISDGNFITLSSGSIYNLPGASLNFPQGYPGAESFIFIPDQFTVPDGKNFYMIAGEQEMRLPGVGSGFGNHITSPHLPMLPQNSMIDNCHCLGFLVDQSNYINPVILVLQPNGASTYTVPAGAFLVIKSGLDGTNFLALNNIAIDFFSTAIEAIVIPGGIQIKNTSDDEMILTGYLGN